MTPDALIINQKDNVSIALHDIAAGETANLSDGSSLAVVADIKFSHKLLLVDVIKGEDIIKYGQVIGQATQDLKKGDWLHTHNLTLDEHA